MATFTTPFWIAVAGVTVAAAGTAWLSRPGAGLPASAAAHLAALDRQTPRLADVAVPEEADAPSDPADRAPLDAALPAGSPYAVDTLGRLVVNDRTLAVLDSWLALVAHGHPLASLEPRLRAKLPALAAERAWDLLQRHAAYREAERELLSQLRARQPLPTPRELLDQQMALRRRHYDTLSVQQLYGVQEARGLYASEVARIFADPTLGPAQQQQRLLALRMSLPPEVAAQEFGGTEFSFAMEKQVAEMRANGESDAEVTFLRRQYVDTEGAKSAVEREREQLEAERAAWALRHPGFIRERDQVYAASLPVPEQQERLERLLEAHFPSAERERARRLAGF